MIHNPHLVYAEHDWECACGWKSTPEKDARKQDVEAWLHSIHGIQGARNDIPSYARDEGVIPAENVR